MNLRSPGPHTDGQLDSIHAKSAGNVCPLILISDETGEETGCSSGQLGGFGPFSPEPPLQQLELLRPLFGS